MTLAASFPMPQKVEAVVSEQRYAKFIAAPFQSGFGHTIGNSLRRVLLSSMEGSAISAVRIDGASHEFASLPNVVEDITDIVLNLKNVRLCLHGDVQKTLEIRKDKAGEVTAGDIITDGTVEVKSLVGEVGFITSGCNTMCSIVVILEFIVAVA